MKEMMKKLRYAAAVVAGMFALGAQAETYYLRHGTDYKADASGSSSMNGGGTPVGWDTSPDGTTQVTKAMTAGNTYVLLGQVWHQYNKGSGQSAIYDERNSADLRPPNSKSYTVPAPLVMQGGRLNIKSGNNNTLTIPDLVVKPAITHSCLNEGEGSSTVKLAGDSWVVEENATLGIHLSAEDTADKGRGFEILSTITGTGSILYYSNPTFVEDSGKIKGPCTLALNGDFRGFTGPIRFFGNDKYTATIKNADSFGGEPETLSTNVVLNSVQRTGATAGIKVVFDCDVTTGPNRGWDFGSGTVSSTLWVTDQASGILPNAHEFTKTSTIIQSTIEVTSGHTLTIEGPITGTVGLNKTGAGTLVFAHPAFAEPINLAGAQTISAETLKGYSDTIAQWMAEQALADTGDLCFGLDCACLGNDGETVTFETSVTNLPANTVVKFHYSTDQEVWNEREIAFTAPGVVTNTIDGLTADTPYYYYFTASDGARTQTKAVRTFTTIGSAALGPGFSLAANRRVVTATGSLAAAGCGSATASLYAQLNGVWTLLTTEPITAGPFVLTCDLKDLIDFGTKPTFKAVVVNTSPSGRSAWTNETATATQAFDDLTVYTWTGEGVHSAECLVPGAKRWRDPANWANDAAGADCQGYPVGGATAVFPSGEHTVEVDTSATLAKLDLSAKDATIVLRGVNDAAITATTLDTGVTADTAFGATRWNSSITFDALTVTASNTIYVPQGGEIVVDHGAALKVAGLKMLSTSSAYAYSRGLFTLQNGSTVNLTGAFTAGGDVVVTIDDSTFSCGNNYDFNTKNGGYAPLGATTVLKGRHPLLKIAGSCLPNADYDYYVGGEFVFEIPAGGYTEAPVQMSGKYHFLDNTPKGGNTRIRVAAESAAFAAASALTQPLVIQTNGGSYYTRYAVIDWQPLRDPNAAFVCSSAKPTAGEVSWTPVGEFSGNAFQLGVTIPGGYTGPAPMPAPIAVGGMPGLNGARVAEYDANAAYVPTTAELNAGEVSLKPDYAFANLPSQSAFVYVGYAYFARGAYYFWASYDDCLRLDIDGTQVLKSGNADMSATYKCTETGWRQLRLYVGNAAGAGGPKVIPGFYYRDLQRDNAERFLVDFGDGALLRTQPPSVVNTLTATELKRYPAGYAATLTRTGDLKRANVYANGTRIGQFAANATELATGLFRVAEAPETLVYRVVPVRTDGTEFLPGELAVTVDPATATVAASTATCELIETTATAARFRVTASPSGATAEVVIDALTPGSTGTATVTATVDGEEFVFADQTYTTTAIPAAAPAAVNATVKRLGANTFVYTFLKDGSITLPAGAKNFRALVVAGGGAGGRTQGAGGGAGGMIDTATSQLPNFSTSQLPNFSTSQLSSGTYSVTVGKGGEPTTGDAKTTHSTNGGDSLLSDAQGVPLLHAIGGGAGGNGTDAAAGYKGNDGGSGGGYNRINTAAAVGTDGQGCAGGKGVGSNNSNCSGGGGGAGTPGGDATTTAGGDGGDGKVSDITGEEVWYAGGGGGSANAATLGFGKGGKGGGGSADYYARAEDGVDGLGGGGAGGSSLGGSVYGGRGGSGVVILRFDLEPGDPELQVEPILEVTGDELVKGGYSLAIDYELRYLGKDGASCDLELVYGFTPDDLSMRQPLATGVKAGGRAVFTALMPGRTYYYAVKATNDRGFANTDDLLVRSVTIKPLVEAATTLAGGLPGVWQAQFDGMAAFDGDIMTSPTRRRELGPMMGFVRGTPSEGEVAYTSELDGVKTYWDIARTFGYKGVIYLESGLEYTFGTYCDDYGRIVVNGEIVAENIGYMPVGGRTYTVAKSGWYPIEMWIGNNAGAAGYGDTWGANYAFSYTTKSGIGFHYNAAKVSGGWAPVRAYADGGALLRLAPPGRGIEAVETDDGTYRITLGEGVEGHDYIILACSGAGYGGEIPEDWETAKECVAADGEIGLELGEDVRFVRFFTRDLTTGETAGAATILRTAVLKAPVLGEVTATADAGGCSISLGGTAENAATVTVYYRSANDPAELAVTVPVADDGMWSARLTGLTTATEYTYSVVAAGANGGTDRAETKTLSTPGAGAFASVNLFNDAGRKVRFRYGVSTLGAGANTMTLTVGRWRNGESMGRDATIAYTAAVVSNVTACGQMDLVWDATDSDFAWGDVLSWRLTLASTADDGTAYSSSVTASTTLADAAPIAQLYDPNTYTWTGEGVQSAECLVPGAKRWTDPANWRSDGVVVTGLGYPDHGAKVVFETPATVALDRAVEINTITLAAGTAEQVTDVKIVGVDAETSFIILQKPLSPQTANGACAFNAFTRLELDALTMTCDGTASEGITMVADSALVLDNRALLCLASGKNVSCEQDNVRFELHGDSAAFFANLLIMRSNSWVILDDGHLVLNGTGQNQGYAKINTQIDNNWKSDDCGILFMGDHPELVCDRVMSSSSTDRKDPVTQQKPAYGHLRFLVPAGGYRHSPIREKGQGYAVFSSDTGVKLEVMPESPCFAAAGTTVTRLVDWPYQGITGTAANKTVVLPEGCSYEWKNLYASPNKQNAALFVTLPGKGEGVGEGVGVGEGEVVKNYGPYEIHIYTNANETAYFTLDEDAEVEVLLVAGGGAGGWGQQGSGNTYGGGGGGAGGVVSKTLSLESGVYPIRVGRGGMNYPSAYWVSPLNENGLDSTAFGLVAYGGGAGGTYEKFSEGGGRYGQNGGSCGGNTRNIGAGQAGGVAGQGHSGGVGTGSNIYRANGGGGAGSAAANITTSTANGAGGDGVASDITGVSVIYGGGGGAGSGANYYAGGAGGLGGGGRGLNWNVEDATGVDGVNGLGGGGGGGAQDADRGNGENAIAHTCTRTGGKGGDGVVIVRVKKNPAQTTALREATPTVGGAVVSYEDFSTSPSTIQTIELTGYGFGVATNYTLNGETIAFTTLAENPGADASLPGLYTARIGSAMAWSQDVVTLSGGTRELGTTMANTRTGGYSALDPSRYDCWTVNDTWGYVGYMYLEEGTYYFFGRFKDYLNLVIDGTVIKNYNKSYNWWKLAYVCPKTGWYPVDFRFSHGTGTGGPDGQFPYGVAMTRDSELYNLTPTDDTSYRYAEQWIPLMDPGDGSLFRTAPPADRILRPQGVMRDAAGTGIFGSLVAESGVGAVGTPELDVWVVTGEAYLENAATNDWIAAGGKLYHVGTFAIDAASLSFKLSELGAANYVRFVGYYRDGSGERATWSETVHLPSVTERADSTPVVSVAAVTTDAISAEIAVDVLYAGGETCDISVRYGLKPDALIKEATILSGVEEGQHTGVLAGLAPNHTYYVQIRGENPAGGESAWGEVFSFTTAASAVNPVAPREGWQRTVEIVATNLTGETATSLSVRVGPGEQVENLYALVGRRIGDQSTSTWARKVLVAESVPAGGGEYVYQLGDGWGTDDFAVRFVLGCEEVVSKPFDAQVEYLESTGSEWIDSGVKGKPTTKATVDVQFLATTVQQRIFGESEDSDLGGLSFAVYINGSGKWASAMQNGKGDFVDSTVIADTARHTFVLDGPDSGRFSIDGTVKTTRTNTRTRETVMNLGIFCDNRKAAPCNFATAKLYSLKIEEAGEDVRDFYPVRKDGVGYLYDAVSGELFGNAAASGAFLVGGDVALSAPLKTSVLGCSAVYCWTDPAAPRIVAAEVSGLASGCSATVSGTAANAVKASVTVGDTIVPATFAEGAFTATVEGLTPGATYTWFATVENADGEIDSTPAASFTLPGEAALSMVTTVTRDQRQVTLAGTVTLGAGTNVVTLLVGTTKDNLAPVDCRLVYDLADYDTLSPQVAYELVWSKDDFGGTLYFGVRVENAAYSSEIGAGQGAWSKTVANTTAQTFTDDATYTWVGNGVPSAGCLVHSAKRWSDAANWSCSSADRWDYPASSAKVAFPAGAAAVELDLNVTLASWTFAEGADVMIESANGSAVTVNNVWEQNDPATITFGEGLTAVFGGNCCCYAEGVTFVVSNATLQTTAAGLYVRNGGTIRVKGERALVKTRQLRPSNSATADSRIVFTVPENGWATPPIVSSGASQSAGDGEATKSIVIEIDPDSPACHVDSNLNVPLIGWTGSYGINTNRIAFAATWPDNDVDYALASDSTTGPWYPLASWERPTVETHGFGVHIEGTLDGRPILRFPEAVAIGPDSVTLRLKVVPGTGTDGVALKAVVWPTLVGASAAVTNDIALVTEANDAYLFTLDGLDPETAYRVQVIGTSTLGGTSLAATSPVFGFTTAEIDEQSYFPHLALIDGSLTVADDMIAAFDWQYINAGYSATGCAFTLEYWHDGVTNAVPLPVDVPQQIRTTLPPLKPATAYGFRVKAENDLDPARVSYTPVVEFETKAEEFRDAWMVESPGLWMTKLNATFDVDTPVKGAVAAGKTASPNQEEIDPFGMSMSGCGSQNSKYSTWTNPETGTTWTRPKDDKKTFAYQGWIYLEGGVTYRFVEGAWDYAKLTIDGTVVLNDSNTSASTYGTIMREESGWYAIDIRLGHGSGNTGTNGGVGGYSFNYTISSETTYSGSGAWQPLLNTEDNVFLAAEKPQPSGFAIESCAYDGTTLATTLSREGDAASDVYACYGATYGGVETNGWESVVRVSAFPEGVTRAAAILTATEAIHYVRFFSVKDGWSETVFLPETPVAVPAAPVFGVTVATQVRETSARFLGYLSMLGADATGVEIVASYGETAEAADGEDTIMTISADAFEPSVALDLELFGLKPRQHYFVKFVARNDQGQVSAASLVEIDTLARGSIGAEVLAPSSEDSKIAVQSETRDLETGERVIIFSATSVNNTDTPEPAVFRVTTPGYAEVLVVGGGGAGGCYTSQTGGGGGAGGFQYFESMYFAPGDYLMAVGPGAIARGENGPSGRKSTITLGSTVLVEALGGDGGRRQNNDGTQTKSGVSSGGGVIGYHTWVNLGTPGQGNNGGNGCKDSTFGGSGGGGAGAPGGDAVIINGVKTCGNGGDGLPCAITGETLYYAGGGGGAGAGNDVVSGRGGLGGGGSGTSGNGSESLGNREARNAVNGTGGGGGAGGNGTYPPGNGGSGTIILRFVPEDSTLAEHPVAQLNAITPKNDANDVPGVDVSYRIVSEGAGKLVTVDFEYGTDINSFRSVRFSDGAFVGTCEENFTGLRANVTYYGRLKVTDEKGTVAYSRVLSFTTLDGDDSSVDQTAPRFSDVSYGTTNRQHKVEITATGTNFVLAEDATTVKLLVGTDPVALVETPITVASLTDEAVTVFCDAVDFDTPYYGALVIDNGDFLTQSPVLAFTVSGASVLLSSAVSVGADSQRTLVFSGVVKSLGAGETTAKLYLSTVNASSLELAQTIAVTATGYFEFAPVTFEWDQTAYYRIDVENSFQDQKWTSTGTAGSMGACDYAGYRWIPADDDGVHLWTDAANWEQTTDHAPGKGYPSGNAGNNGSVAYFPAMGYEYVVDVNGGNVASANVVPSENARIRFRSATGNGWSGIVNGKFSWAKNESMVFDGFSATLGQNTSSSLTTSNSFALVNGSSFRTGNYSDFQMNATGIAVYVDPTSQLGPFVRANTTSATVGGTDAEVILEGRWSIGVINVFGSDTTLGKGVIFRGSKAQMTMDHAYARLRGTATNTAEAPSMPFVFEVPVDGYENVPVSSTRTDHGLLFDSGTVTLKVSADSPAALAETDGVYPLVSAVNGINPDGVLLAPLPHPDTDSWILTYDNTDATTGTLLTGISVRLVGRPFEPTAPVARLLHVKESTAGSVTFAADFRCGGTSPSATWSYWLDDETEAEATTIGTFNEVENFEEFTVGGLERGSQHVLHLKGASVGGESVVDYDFGTVGDRATLGTVEGVTTEPYGPYTKIVADAETEGVFEVLVACEAELSFDDGEAVAFTLNTGTYTVKNGVLANEAEAIAELAGAETLTIKVQTREVENEPLIDVVAAPVGFGDVTIPLTVLSLGGELTRPPEKPVTEVAAKLVWGYHPEHLVYETDLGTIGLDALEVGVTNLTVTTLPSDTFFYAKVLVDNGEPKGVGTSHLFTFQTVSVGDGMLYQASKKGFKDEAWNVLGDESCVLVPGGPQAALHGNKGGGLTPAWSDADGNEITWVGGSMYGYVGYIHLQAMNYAFVAGIDDNCRMRIYSPDADLAALANHEPLFTSGTNFDGNNFKPQVFACPDEGWYAVEIFVGDGTGQYGAYSVTRKLRYCELGDGETAPAENDASWCDLVDSGDGSRFSSYCASTNMPIYDVSAPVVANAVADVSQGDRLIVACAVEGAASFAIFLGSNEAMDDWVEVPVPSVSSVPSVSLTLDNLTPGTNFWWQLVATSAAGVRIATVPQQAVMPAASSFASGPTVTQAQDTLKVTGSISPGAGETWALGAFTVGGVTTNVVLGCWTNGVDRAPYGLNWSHAFAGAWNETVTYAITLSNGVNDISWTSESVAGEKTLADTATYIWVAKGEGAVWNAADNWSCSASSGIGYPTETSTAKFDAADGADVVLDQDRTVKTFTVAANARIVFSGPFTFTAPGTGEWNFNLAGVTLGAKDGATFRHAGTFFATAENQTFLADNATLHFNNFYTCKDTGKSTANCTIRLSGEAPLFLSQGGFGPQQSSADYTFVLNVPERGWTEPVIRSNGLTKQVKFGATDQTSARTTKFRFAIDPASPFLKRGITKKMKIVDWPYGFSAANMDFDELGKLNVELDSAKAKTCELSLNGDDPASATLLYLTLKGIGGTAIIIVDGDEQDLRYDTVAEAIADSLENGRTDTIRILEDETDETFEVSGVQYAPDLSKEIAFVKDENENIVPVVQTSTEIMREVRAGGATLTSNTPKLRTFLLDNGVAAYLEPKTSAEAISTALEVRRNGEGENGLPLWKDYALGISPTDSVKAVADAAKDTDLNAITLSIPTMVNGKGFSGDFDVFFKVFVRDGGEYTVVKDGVETHPCTATDPSAIKIPLATGIYDVKIVFEPAKS